MTEFNIATKMSECLASGTVTVVVGPEYAAMVRFLEPTGAACLLTNETLPTLPVLLRNIIDVNYRRSVIEQARKLVLAQLSTAVMRNRWLTGVGALNY